VHRKSLDRVPWARHSTYVELFNRFLFWRREEILATDLNLDELKRRLREGDYLEISTGGGAYEVWAEPLGNPPSVYYEGEQHPLAQLEPIAEKIFREMRAGEISCRWVEDD
jgi:hypothetical protein